MKTGAKDPNNGWGDDGFLDGLSYIRKPSTVRPFVVEPLISPGAMMNFYGHPKVGKSLLALGLSIAISSQDEQELWMDRYPIRMHGPVCWFEADNSAEEWKTVVKRTHDAGYDLSNIMFCDQDRMPYPFDVLDNEAKCVDWFASRLKRVQDRWGTDPVFTVLDTIREIHSGDEDKSHVMRNVLVALQTARHHADSNTSFGIISHSRKGAGLDDSRTEEENEGDVINENRGSSAFAAKMQAVVRVTLSRAKFQGYFTAGGRNMGRQRFRMVQEPPSYQWRVDVDPFAEFVKELRAQNPDWSIRQIAKELAKEMKLGEEKARSIARRTLEAPVN